MTNTFLDEIKSEGETLVTAGESAWAQAKAELAKLTAEIEADLVSAINTAVADAESGKSVEDIETDVLNILAGESANLVKALASGVLQILIVFARSAL